MAPAPVINTFTQEEELFIIHLKEEVGTLSWVDLALRYNQHFPDSVQRSQGSLQVSCSLRRDDNELVHPLPPSNRKNLCL